MWQEGYDPTEWFSAELLEMIFSLLDDIDLLDCSLVNKKWRATAASVIFKYKECIVLIEEPCCELLELEDTLRKADFRMINGIHIRVGDHEGCCKDWKTPELKKIFSALINWPFQYIDVELDHYHYDDKITCDVVSRLAKEIFWTSRRTVRELAIGFKDEETDFFRHDLARERNGEDESSNNKVNVFPDLRSIEFYGEYFPSDFNDFVNFSAQSLTEIKGQLVELGVAKSWDETALRALKSVSITPEGRRRGHDDCVDFETFKQFASFDTGLHYLRTNDTKCRDEVAFPPSWLNPFAQIFRNSWGTLKRLDFCASELMKIIMQLDSLEEGALMFPNVTRLDLNIPEETSARVDRSILRRIQIGIRFPKLEELIINFGECHHELEGEEYEEDYEECPASDLSLDLETRSIWLNQETLEYFVNTFPLLTSLSVIIYNFFEDREHAYSLSTIFSSFPHLTCLRLELNFSVEDVTIQCFSLDAIFCGINFEEVQKIKSDCRGTGLDLKNMNIVPLRPGITSAANLKSLQVFPNHRRRSHTPWLSKISEVLAFDRMPKLHVFS